MVREKDRWFLIEFSGTDSPESIIKFLRKKIMEFFGLFGAITAFFKVIEVNKKRKLILINIPVKGMDILRAALFELRKIDNKKIFLNDFLVSGTIKKLKEKQENKITLEEFLNKERNRIKELGLEHIIWQEDSFYIDFLKEFRERLTEQES